MPININGQMKASLEVPCCNDEKLTVTYETTDNTFIADLFKKMAERIGIKATLTDLDAEKGGGG